MPADLQDSAIAFARMWCQLFVGEAPEIDRAIGFFRPSASILIPGAPYRLDPEAEREEIAYSHLVDGRGQVSFWQVLEPRVELVGDVAVVAYYARFAVGRPGESVVKCAKETLVLSRDGPGWRIAHLHHSAA